MYAIAVIRYRKPLDEVLPHVDAHRAYLKGLYHNGWLIASGPVEPRAGGALILRIPEGDPLATLDRIRDQDPFVLAKVAQYEMWPWFPVIGEEGLDTLGNGSSSQDDD